MPIYEYRCEQCGPFTALRRLSEFEQPAHCDGCGALSARIPSLPRLALVGHAVRVAHERNERSVHEPAQLRRSGCGCSGVHHCQSTRGKPAAATTVQGGTPLQGQTRKTARPWTLGH